MICKLANCCRLAIAEGVVFASVLPHCQWTVKARGFDLLERVVSGHQTVAAHEHRGETDLSLYYAYPLSALDLSRYG